MTIGRTLQAGIFVLALASPVSAAENGKLSIELNDLQQAENGCRAVFVVNNGLDATLDDLALRIVTFDGEGHATRFLSLDVGRLPVGKTRILRFDLGADSECADVSRIVLDDVTTCDGDGLDTATCLAAIEQSSRAGIPFDF